MKNSSLESSRKRMTTLTYIALILGAVIMVFPFLWMILFRVLCAVAFSSMAGYAFAMLKF